MRILLQTKKLLPHCDIPPFLDTNPIEYSKNMNAQQPSEFVKIVEQHQGIINNLCCIYYTNREDQQDARQDIVLQLWKAFPNFRGEAKISTWIYKVSLNTILVKIRNQSRRVVATSVDHIHDLQLPGTIGMDDDVQLLRAVIEYLKADDKALVVLYLEGYKNQEIAEMLGLSISNVSTRLHRIKSKLKQHFQKLNHVTRSIKK